MPYFLLPVRPLPHSTPNFFCSRAAAQMSPSLIRHISSSGGSAAAGEGSNTEEGTTSFMVAPCSCNSPLTNVAQVFSLWKGIRLNFKWLEGKSDPNGLNQVMELILVFTSSSRSWERAAAEITKCGRCNSSSGGSSSTVSSFAVKSCSGAAVPSCQITTPMQTSSRTRDSRRTES